MRRYLKARISSVTPHTVTVVMRASLIAMLALPCGAASVLVPVLLAAVLLSILIFPVAFAVIYLIMIFGTLILGHFLGILALNIFISYVVLPISTVLLPPNYWVQQFGLMLFGTGIAFLMANAAYASLEWGMAGAVGGLIASAAFAKCVRDLWVS